MARGGNEEGGGAREGCRADSEDPVANLYHEPLKASGR